MAIATPCSFNYRVLNSIDYIGNEDGNRPREQFNLEERIQKRQKRKFILLSWIVIWVLSLICVVVSVYFSTYEHSNKSIRTVMTDSLNEIIKSWNITVDDKFLKRFDKFLYKRKGLFSVTYEIDYIAWIIIAALNTTIDIVLSIIIIRKIINIRGR